MMRLIHFKEDVGHIFIFPAGNITSLNKMYVAGSCNLNCRGVLDKINEKPNQLNKVLTH